MISDLKKFREELFDDYAYEGENGVLLGKKGKHLYKECTIEELPVRFQKNIEEHMKTGSGMGSGLIYDNASYYFSNTHNKSLHKCFVKMDKIPEFTVKITDFKLETVRKFIEDTDLRIGCRVHTINEDGYNGYVYTNLNSQEYFVKENGTGIEELDEYFFWKGETKKKLMLHFDYKCEKAVEMEKNELKNIISDLYREGSTGVFAEYWDFI